jgi:hypothetical protein
MLHNLQLEMHFKHLLETSQQLGVVASITAFLMENMPAMTPVLIPSLHPCYYAVQRDWPANSSHLVISLLMSPNDSALIENSHGNQ